MCVSPQGRSRLATKRFNLKMYCKTKEAHACYMWLQAYGTVKESSSCAQHSFSSYTYVGAKSLETRFRSLAAARAIPRWHLTFKSSQIDTEGRFDEKYSEHVLWTTSTFQTAGHVGCAVVFAAVRAESRVCSLTETGSGSPLGFAVRGTLSLVGLNVSSMPSHWAR